MFEVGPRDGLQNEPEVLPPGVRAELVRRLVAAGISSVEVASFVDPRRVPQMAAAEEVVSQLERRPGVVYAGLALNERGYDRLAEAGLDPGWEEPKYTERVRVVKTRRAGGPAP